MVALKLLYTVNVRPYRPRMTLTWNRYFYLMADKMPGKNRQPFPVIRQKLPWGFLPSRLRLDMPKFTVGLIPSPKLSTVCKVSKPHLMMRQTSEVCLKKSD
jgi:hypothetical protein